MKKVFFVALLLLTFALQSNAQVFLDPNWNISNSVFGDVWRYNGSVAINAYNTGSQETGFFLRNDFAAFDSDWGGHWLGFQRGNINKLNLCTGTGTGDPVMMNGYWGIGMRTRDGKFAMTENGVVVIGEIPKATIRTIAAPIYSWQYEAFKLYVQGGIRTERIKVDLQAAWGDYVFEQKYKLRPLNAVEQTIKETGHLPDMPSAVELKEKGLDLGDMAALQQVKIEELFLHLIEMDKRLQATDKRVQDLERENAALKAELANLRK
jgi:hypothetical protein